MISASDQPAARSANIAAAAATSADEREPQTSRRKDAHLDICLNQPVVPAVPAVGLGGWTLEYNALPELDLDEVDLSVTVLGRRLKAPIIIGAMTGGSERARVINQRLARAAARAGVGMALGSQRAMIADPSLTPTFAVREQAPQLPLLIGNVGAVQLNYDVSARAIQDALEAVGADALNFHLNPLQEAIQPEGDTRFSGLWSRLEKAITAISLPCLVKEVGAGIGVRAAHKLSRLPLVGVEVAGVGGTSWAKVESYRAPAGSPQARAGQLLQGFGISTADSIRICREAFGQRLVVASGGIRHGMDVAVALALGADCAALAKPLLEAADDSQEAVDAALEALIYQLRVICFCTGAKDIEALRHVALRPVGPTTHGAQR